MKWTARLGELRDIKACVALLEPYQMLYGPGYAWLTDVLHFLFEQLAINFEVWCEGLGRDGKVIGFDICTYISDDFAEQMLTGPPFIVRQILDMYREDRLPILTPRAAYGAHSERGLTILHLFGVLDRVQYEHFHVYLDRCVESYYRRLRGLRCRRIFGEAYGDLFLQWLTSAGYSIANDYTDFFGRYPLQMPPEEIRPRLVVATAEDAARDFGSRIAPAFRYVAPRFGFSPSEEAMLRLAWKGETDEELAESLQISIWTVKKRGRQMDERVAGMDSEVVVKKDDGWED